MRVFVDTNIYLNLISDKKEEKFDVLEKLTGKKSIELVLPVIIVEEFVRRSPSVASEYWQIFQDQSPTKSLKELEITEETDFINKVEKSRKEYLEHLGKLKEVYLQSIETFRGKLEKLSKNACATPETAKLLELASKRKLKGNPPGGNRIGDNLVWEIILRYCTNDNLSIVSNDPDWRNIFKSEKNKYYLNPLLMEEWKSKSDKSATLFGSLGEFINSVTKEETITNKDIEEEKRNTTLLGLLSGDTGIVGSSVISTPSGTVPIKLSGDTGATLWPSDTARHPRIGSALGAVSIGKCPQCGNLLDDLLYTPCKNCRESNL